MLDFCKRYVIVQNSALYLVPVALLVLPLRWLMAVVFAALIHELWHILAIHLMGGRILEIRIGAAGAVIETEPMSNAKEMLASLSGPAGSLSLLFFAKWLPCTAFCALAQAVYNLLPMYPLDGGRALHCLLLELLPMRLARRAERIIKCGTIILFALFLIILKINGLLVVLLIVLLILHISEKFLAKKAN